MTAQGARVLMYTAGLCSFCTAAKALLQNKGITWEEVRVDTDPDRRRKMETLTGRRTVPQILIDGRPVGGYQDLRILDMAGELDGLLAGAGASA